MTNTPAAELIRNALDFANRAAGEGIVIDGLSPEDFLMKYSVATGDEDWDALSDRVASTLRAQAEIARLTAERDQEREEHTDNLELLDQALARAAAAAMEMRERAAVIMDSRAEYWAEVSNDFDAAFAKEDAKDIRALPIDPDAQNSLDKLLAKAREDAIREAADAAEDYCSDMPDLAGHGHSVGIKDRIRDLLNDGERA